MNNVQVHFLNTSGPGFPEAEARLLSEGWEPKRALRSATGEIRDAYRFFRIKQLGAEKIAQGIQLTPRNSEDIAKTALNESRTIPIEKFKMYTRPISKSGIMNEEYEVEEEFISDNLQAQMVQLEKNSEKIGKEVERAIKAAENAEKNTKSPAVRSRANVLGVYSNVARQLRQFANTSKRQFEQGARSYRNGKMNAARVQLNQAHQSATQALDLKKRNVPMELLASKMASTNFGTRYQFTPQGVVYRPEYEGTNEALTKYYNKRFGKSNGGKTRKSSHMKRRKTRRN